MTFFSLRNGVLTATIGRNDTTVDPEYVVGLRCPRNLRHSRQRARG